MDTGATDHITSDLDHLTIREVYNSNERVHVGTGAGLHISHVGHSTLNNTAESLSLFNILHVPHITKKAKDNDIFIEIHSHNFIVKDRESRRRVLQGRCEVGLYPFDPSEINTTKCAMFTTSTSKEQWHRIK